jgi:MFS family permease
VVVVATLGDHFGRRRIYVAGPAVFIAASVAYVLSTYATVIPAAQNPAQICHATVVLPAPGAPQSQMTTTGWAHELDRASRCPL